MTHRIALRIIQPPVWAAAAHGVQARERVKGR